ncbi:MAG: MotA/TolQ/ExbB proton channel family protein [Candidatus Cloacimonadales bacterium]|nr:MotA/TolQ/ExbB proton channel family protein [Candidatus Cloacimonadales bacterium]
MKRNLLVTLIMIFSLNIFLSTALFAQEANIDTDAVVETEEVVSTQTDVVAENTVGKSGLEYYARKVAGSYLVDLMIDGGWVMWPMLILAIWGIAICIWKVLQLSYARINLNNFLAHIIPLIEQKKYKEAAEYAQKIRGPVAKVSHAGLLKAEMGTEQLETAIENSSTVEMAFLEKGFIHINTTINLAPMFGFFGTILGMIEAFDAIAKAGEVDPTIVADGIKVALITTLAGLAIAIPVQFINNVLLTMVDGLIIDMQRAADKIVETYVEKK